MRAVAKWIVAFAGIIGSGAIPLHSEMLRGAVARVDMTPEPGVAMWGFAARKGPATGTIDPIYARILVLASGEKRIAIITLDLGRAFGPASLEKLRESVRKNSQISYILIGASHTHSGPVVKDQYADNRPPTWEEKALKGIAQAIEDACARLKPVRVGADYGIAYIGYNRLQTKLDRSSWLFGNDFTQVISSPVDPTVAVLRVDGEDGQPIAILVNYACHPVVFSGGNREYSADYPAVMASTVEASFPSHPLTFFLQGAAGDIDPYYANTPKAQDPQLRRKWTGERLGTEAARVAHKIETKVESDGTLDFTEDAITVPTRWTLAQAAAAYSRIWNGAKADPQSEFLKPEIMLQTSTLLLNKRIAFMSMSGEPFVEFQVDWRNRCPVRDSFFVGYANGYHGYLPTIGAAVRGGYGASNAETWTAVGSGERMVNNSLVRIYESLEKLTTKPEE